MSKIKILVGLATLTCAIAAMSTPANAFFEATTPGATKGPLQSLPLTGTLKLKVGGTVITTVTCTRTAASTGFWNIQTSEENVITKGTKQQQQPGTKVGPHEAITITNWGECKALTGAQEGEALVAPCRLQVAQPGKNTAANQEGFGSVQTDCVVSIPKLACTIVIEQLPANHNLKEVHLSNNMKGGVEIKANVETFTWIGKGAGCAAVGLTGGTEASFSTGVEGGEAVVTALQKLI